MFNGQTSPAGLSVPQTSKNIFFKFNRRHYVLIFKFNVALLRVGLSQPEFYGNLVYEIKKLIGRNDFSFQFRKKCYTCTLQTDRI